MKTQSFRWLPVSLLVVGLLLCALLAYLGRVAWQAWQDLHPPRIAVALAAGADALPGVQEVQFTASDGVVLAAWYVPPAPGAPPAAVLLVHGHGANRAQLLAEARWLVGAGYAVLLPDLRAHGRSGGRLASSGAHEQLDVAASLAFLRARPEMAGAPIGAIGFSIGASALAEVAARDPGIAALVFEAMPATLVEDINADYPLDRPLERWLAQRVHAWVAGVRLEDVRPIDRLCGLAPRPILLVHGDVDPAFGAADAGRLRKAACGPVEMVLVEGAAHGGFAEAGGEAYTRALLAFLQRSLRPGL